MIACLICVGIVLVAYLCDSSREHKTLNSNYWQQPHPQPHRGMAWDAKTYTIQLKKFNRDYIANHFTIIFTILFTILSFTTLFTEICSMNLKYIRKGTLKMSIQNIHKHLIHKAEIVISKIISTKIIFTGHVHNNYSQH